MSLYGDAIIERLPAHSVIHNKTNDMNKIINDTIGEWLDNYDIIEWFEQFFLDSAEGKYLDLHGKQFGVQRKLNEDDDSYRQRISLNAEGHLNIKYLTNLYNVELYTKVNNYDNTKTLLSDNYYLCDYSDVDNYFGVADIDTQNIINKKFILNSEDITWL